MDGDRRAPELTIAEAASVLRIPVESVEALVGAGYLQTFDDAAGHHRVAQTELKAFLARNDRSADGRFDADAASASVPDRAPADVGDLVAALRRRTPEMAQRALELFTATFPEVELWKVEDVARFLDEARERFDAIISVSQHVDAIDDVLLAELAEVGAAAARAGAALPQVLLALRISRDLVVQTALDITADRDPAWTMPLALVLTHVLSSLDHLCDVIARGWTEAALATAREGA